MNDIREQEGGKDSCELCPLRKHCSIAVRITFLAVQGENPFIRILLVLDGVVAL